MQGRSPSPAQTWDELFSDFYLRAYAEDERQSDAEAQAFAAATLAGCPGGGDLLDVACGFGRHAVPLARAGFRVVGVDRSEALLEEARRRADGERGPELVRADYRELPFKDESFDAAVNLFTSLGYLGDEEDVRVLAEIRRVLKPGGRLVLLEHVRGEGRLAQWQDRLTPLHRRVAGNCRLNRDTQKTVAAAGFDAAGVQSTRIPGSHPLVRSGIQGVAIKISS